VKYYNPKWKTEAEKLIEKISECQDLAFYKNYNGTTFADQPTTTQDEKSLLEAATAFMDLNKYQPRCVSFSPGVPLEISKISCYECQNYSQNIMMMLYERVGFLPICQKHFDQLKQAIVEQDLLIRFRKYFKSLTRYGLKNSNI
jgi:hypothetical protein